MPEVINKNDNPSVSIESQKSKRGRRPRQKVIKDATVSAAVRTIAILESLAENKNVTLELLAQKVNLAKPTLYRFLKTLKKLGYVIQNDNLEYQLSLKMFNIGAKSIASLDLYTAARPILHKLSEITGETVHLAVMMENKALYIMKMESKHVIRMYSTVGKLAPLHCTSLGKAMLAFANNRDEIIDQIDLVPYTKNTITLKDDLLKELELVRKRGYSIDAEEHEENIFCIGAPIFDITKQVVASISISWPIFRYDASNEHFYSELIISSAHQISSLLGYD